jgi:hypothetical protein
MKYNKSQVAKLSSIPDGEAKKDKPVKTNKKKSVFAQLLKK